MYEFEVVLKTNNLVKSNPINSSKSDYLKGPSVKPLCHKRHLITKCCDLMPFCDLMPHQDAMSHKKSISDKTLNDKITNGIKSQIFK